MTERTKAQIEMCLKLIIDQDQLTDTYEVACLALASVLQRTGHLTALRQLVKQGPVFDGDISSKVLRDDLLTWSLAHRVVCKGQQGYTAAGYRGWDVLRALPGADA